MKIYPTGTCFSDVIDYINFEFTKLVKAGTIKFGPKSPEALGWAKRHAICHGIMINEKGDPYSHAWIETDRGTVFHFGIVNGSVACCEFPKEQYHVEMKVREFTRYTIQEAISFEKVFGRPGPWKQQYLELCRDYWGKNANRAHRLEGSVDA